MGLIALRLGLLLALAAPLLLGGCGFAISGAPAGYQQAADRDLSDARGQLQRAAGAEESVIAHNRGTAQDYLRLSAIFFELGQPADAVRAAKRAVALRPKDAGTENNLGNLYLELGRAGLAAKAFDAAIKVSSVDWQAWDGQAQIAIGKAQWDAALADLRNALATGGPEALTFDEWGRLEAGQNRWNLALIYFQNARSADSTWWQANYDIARALTHLGRSRQAAPYFNRARNLNPGVGALY